MNTRKPKDSNTQKPKGSSVKLNNDELDAAVGGASKIDGKSTDNKRTGTVEIEPWSMGSTPISPVKK
jgi:hypothetical protein